MTPKERAVAALQLRQPDDIVPTFELEFQLTQEAFEKDFQSLHDKTGDALDRAAAHNAELYLQIAERYDYSIIRAYGLPVFEKLREWGAGDKFLLCGESDGTMAIPDGETMLDLAVELSEEPEEVHRRLSASADAAIEWGARQIEAGAELLTMCSDYCFNAGPFLSPKMFAEFVQPYLARVIDAHKRHGALVIKHTDGDIMPIVDQILECQPHGLHSLDPQAGIDIRTMKEHYGDRVCLCGNVNCALMQTGTDAEVVASAEYALEHGMPNGGFIFSTSNVAFKGMALERYELMLDVRAAKGRYAYEPRNTLKRPPVIERNRRNL